MHDVLNQIAEVVWGPAMMALILGTGIYLTVGLRGISVKRIPEAVRLLLSAEGRARTGAPGEISPYAALMTALSATVGVGNIAGVATAIHLGGPGALFWMWMTGVFGLATKYAETFLAISFREKRDGHYFGGPMYYIRLGLGAKYEWLALCFALFATIAALGAGAGIQANAVSHIVAEQLQIPGWITGTVLVFLTAAVLLGGLQHVSLVCEFLVPFMILLFMGGALCVLLLNATALPAALVTIVESAFNGTAAAGGFAGASLAAAMRFGIARGMFSNEAGLGSAAIVHAAARSNDPVKMGTIAMLGTFIDTLVVNTMTGLAIVTTGVWVTGATGGALTAAAFESALPGFGSLIVAFSLVLFAFTTILGWSVYGERSAAFLLGPAVMKPYRALWCGVVGVGAVIQLELAWTVADILNALMALPNLVALLMLSPLVFTQTAARLLAHRNAAIEPSPFHSR